MTDDQRTAKNAIIDAMRAEGISKIVIEYSGSGDEGGIDSIEMERAENAPEQTLRNDLDLFVVPDSGVRVATSLHQAAELFAENLMYGTYGSWQDNEGGSGTMTFDAASNAVLWDHNMFYTDSQTTSLAL
jgi:hypothetical protein